MHGIHRMVAATKGESVAVCPAKVRVSRDAASANRIGDGDRRCARVTEIPKSALDGDPFGDARSLCRVVVHADACGDDH